MCVTIMWSVSFSQNSHRIVWGLVIFEMITTPRPLYLYPKSAEAILFNLYVCYRICDMMCFFVFSSCRFHNIHKTLLGRFVYARDGAEVFFCSNPSNLAFFSCAKSFQRDSYTLPAMLVRIFCFAEKRWIQWEKFFRVNGKRCFCGKQSPWKQISAQRWQWQNHVFYFVLELKLACSARCLVRWFFYLWNIIVLPT